MLDELATDEAHIRVSLITMIEIAIRSLLGLIVSVESITRGMRADEALACLHEIKQRLLAFR